MPDLPSWVTNFLSFQQGRDRALCPFLSKHISPSMCTWQLTACLQCEAPVCPISLHFREEPKLFIQREHPTLLHIALHFCSAWTREWNVSLNHWGPAWTWVQSQREKSTPMAHTAPAHVPFLSSTQSSALLRCSVAGRGRVCSALLSPSSFHLSSFVSTSAKHFWSGSSCSLGNRQAHKKATSGPFLFLLSLTGSFLFICHFTRAPVVLIAGLLRGLWADLPPGAFPVLMYLLWH